MVYLNIQNTNNKKNGYIWIGHIAKLKPKLIFGYYFICFDTWFILIEEKNSVQRIELILSNVINLMIIQYLNLWTLNYQPNFSRIYWNISYNIFTYIFKYYI